MYSFDTRRVTLSPLEKFIKREQSNMLRYLRATTSQAKGALTTDPSLYLFPGNCPEGTPSQDIRLCIDPVHTNENPFSLRGPLVPDFDWCFRLGDPSYDQRHSRYCAAGSINLDTKSEELLLELVDQILEQEPHEQDNSMNDHLETK